MSDVYTKLHGTTVDRFKVGVHSQRVTLTGQTSGANTTTLVDRDSNNFVSDTTIFFTAYVIGKGDNTAAYQIKGCYLFGTTTVSGFVVDTFVDTADFVEPVLAFSPTGELTLTCAGVAGDDINWTAVIDVVLI